MQRAELENYILEVYNAEADHPWAKYPEYEVFRHSGNRKWFALVMDVPKAKLGLSEAGSLPVVNLKCDPIAIGSLLAKDGFFPAYHMSKGAWITVALDGSVAEEELKFLLGVSFDLTDVKLKKRKPSPSE